MSKEIANFDTTLLPELIELFSEGIEDGNYEMNQQSIFDAMDEASIPKEHRKIAAYLWVSEYGAEEQLKEILKQII